MKDPQNNPTKSQPNTQEPLIKATLLGSLQEETMAALQETATTVTQAVKHFIHAEKTTNEDLKQSTQHDTKTQENQRG